jgi:hypothetical protein
MFNDEEEQHKKEPVPTILTDESGPTKQFYTKHPRDKHFSPGGFVAAAHGVYAVDFHLTELSGKMAQTLKFIVKETMGFADKKGGGSYKLFTSFRKDKQQEFFAMTGIRQKDFSTVYLLPLVRSGIVLRVFDGPPNHGRQWVAVNPLLNECRAEFCRRIALAVRNIDIWMPHEQFVKQARLLHADDKIMQNLHLEFREKTIQYKALFEFDKQRAMEVRALLKNPIKHKVKFEIRKGYTLMDAGIHLSGIRCQMDGTLIFSSKQRQRRTLLRP